jgi:DNA helicase II / ATP-dependent DNA helicase PcrA
MQLASQLNEAQLAAVTHGDGPLLVIAGAGSGKTRVLTYRFVHLALERGVDPRAILAVTFTNKAAREMADRIYGMLGGIRGPLSIGTFHSFGARFLRIEGKLVGLDSNYVIYDEDDQKRLLEEVARELSIPSDVWPVPALRAAISREKNGLAADGAPDGGFRWQMVRAAHARYDERLRANGACDFDDLLILPVNILREDERVREKWRARYDHVLIDEYQDTNGAQHELVKLLVRPPHNVFAVGDEDQSIYRWRGARIGNILDFENAFLGTRLQRLERNYRSTGRILAAANAVVSHNRSRRPKTLWTEREAGERIVVAFAPTEADEGRLIAREIQLLMRRGRQPGDIAVLYRTNAQSRALEEGMRRAGIPYIIVGGIRFYERREVKDLLAYLRVILNPRDEISLVRAVAYPPRGVGEKSLEKLTALAVERGLRLTDALVFAGDIAGIRREAARSLADLGALLARLSARLAVESAASVARTLIEETGFLDALAREGGIEAQSRIENAQELVSGMEDFATRTGDSSLGAFLAEVSLLTDLDAYEEREARVSLMTLHNSKGLEFPVVFIAGLEKDLFPNRMSSEDEEGMEEERRLFYVGITRAMDRVFVTGAASRMRYGERLASAPSPFVSELPAEHVDERGVPLLEDDWRGQRPWGMRPRRGSQFGGGARSRDRDTEWNRSGPARRVASPGPTPGADADVDPWSEWPSEERAEPVYDDSGGEAPLRPGDKIRHPLFGAGTIVESSGRGEGQKVVVQFGLAGRRKLVVANASLVRIG